MYAQQRCDSEKTSKNAIGSLRNQGFEKVVFPLSRHFFNRKSIKKTIKNVLKIIKNLLKTHQKNKSEKRHTFSLILSSKMDPKPKTTFAQMSSFFVLFAKMSPDRSQEPPRGLQEASKSSQKTPKRPPRLPEQPPRGLQEAPKTSPRPSKRLQDAPKTPQEAPNTPPRLSTGSFA